MYAFDAYRYDVDVFVSDKAFIKHNKILSDHPSKIELLNVTVEIDPDVEAQKDWAEKLDRLHRLTKLSRNSKGL